MQKHKVSIKRTRHYEMEVTAIDEKEAFLEAVKRLNRNGDSVDLMKTEVEAALITRTLSRTA